MYKTNKKFQTAAQVHRSKTHLRLGITSQAEEFESTDVIVYVNNCTF